MTALAEVHVDRDPTVPFVRITGELDISNTAQVGGMLVEAVPNTALGLVVDVSEIRYLDSAGVHLLFQVARRLHRRRQELCLVAPKGARVLGVLQLVDLPSRVPIYETHDAAVRAVHDTHQHRAGRQ